LQLLYHSIEKTPEGFQAMVPITPQLNAILEAVSEEQLGYAPCAFGLDRLSRMFYFSVAAMTTTGFGDILPLTTSVRLLASAEAILAVPLAKRDNEVRLILAPVARRPANADYVSRILELCFRQMKPVRLANSRIGQASLPE
jgi:hypothetical protein